MAADTVTVAYVHPIEVAVSWHKSFVDMLGYDLANHQRVIRGGWIAMRCGTGGLIQARNNTVAGFLDDKDADWLFWIDTDMGFAPDTVDRLIAAADPVERPVVGALCFMQKEVRSDGVGGYATRGMPTIFDWGELNDKSGFAPRLSYEVNTLTPCSGTGSACILIHRTVLERMREQVGDHWYDQFKNPATGELISEDLSFCARLATLGIPLHVHTGIRTTHLKNVWLGEDAYWQQAGVPPATEPVDVIVPVLHRPQNVKPLMESLKASTGLAEAWFVCEPDDPIEWVEVLTHGGHVIKHPGTFAAKVNAALAHVEEDPAGGSDFGLEAPWILLVGDDVKFHPGWLDHALYIANRFNADVVGTNDLGNPRVVSGEHATHMLIRRSYIDEQGASWDGPGIVCHEGYRHWFVDDEIVTAAKQRGVWQMALGSIIEHLHPAWGKAEHDDVYQLGQDASKKDAATFQDRLRRQRVAA